MKMLWATNGHTWGARFLLDGGFPDPLVEYQRVFSSLGSPDELCQQLPDCTALRFADPLGRQDRAGRVIFHEFVLYGELAQQVATVDDGVRFVWPKVADAFARIWEQPDPVTPLSDSEIALNL